MDINPMMDLLDMRQLKYPGHPSRADKGRKIKQFLEVKPDGQRPEEGQEWHLLKDCDRTIQKVTRKQMLVVLSVVIVDQNNILKNNVIHCSS